MFLTAFSIFSGLTGWANIHPPPVSSLRTCTFPVFGRDHADREVLELVVVFNISADPVNESASR
jgi:hypothetical protein